MNSKLTTLRATAPLDAALGKAKFLVGDAFSFSEIIASHALNGGWQLGYLEGFGDLQTYLEPLFAPAPHIGTELTNKGSGAKPAPFVVLPPRLYFPLKTGLRFSRRALMPS